MNGKLRRTARTLAALVAAGILLAPSTHALADNSEPQPTDWPTVDAPDKQGTASEPQVVKWPAPVQYQG